MTRPDGMWHGRPRGSLARLTTPDPVEKRWPELDTWRRIFLPLLGERAGVRGVVSTQFDSRNGPNRGAESGFLRLRQAFVLRHLVFEGCRAFLARLDIATGTPAV